jgi:hypothetical protein
MEPASSSSTSCSSYGSHLFTGTALEKLWYDVHAGEQPVIDSETIKLLTMGYSNFPTFLQRFCSCYYSKELALAAVAKRLGISEQLAHQRRVVSIALFKILLASKPKNPV